MTVKEKKQENQKSEITTEDVLMYISNCLMKCFFSLVFAL